MAEELRRREKERAGRLVDRAAMLRQRMEKALVTPQNPQ
jgi:hypothetical protein